MHALILALIAFVGSHFLLSHPLRAPLVKAVGDKAFQGLYTLVGLASFAWMIIAFRAAPQSAPLWPVGDGIWGIASGLMFFGSILFAGSFARNPALAKPGAAADATRPARGTLAITRHPMMWAFALWGSVHILVSPQEKVIWLSAGMIILALGGSIGQDAKKAVLMGDAWRDWQSRTSFIPFANQLRGRSTWSAAWPGRTSVLFGIALWLVASYLHPLLGGPIAGIWRWL
jgi:uncharacterized membrane protein